MRLSLLRPSTSPAFPKLRRLRSDAALEAIARAAEERTPAVALYNYPSFSGAFSALFVQLFHSHLNLPCLVLPFSSVAPFRVDDLCYEGLKTCYFLDFIGPKEFAAGLSRTTACEVVCFDHRRSALSQVPHLEGSSGKLTFHINLQTSSSRAVYEYFSSKLKYAMSTDENSVSTTLVDTKNQERVELLLKYLEDGDLRQWRFRDIKAFNIGISEWRSKLNCITNPHMYEQGVRADSNPDISDEIGKELSIRSAAAGLRPIGAVIFMQRKNLKMCLRSTNDSIDTSEIAKAYGGGGSPYSSSFIIRMDEYNQWLSVNSPS